MTPQEVFAPWVPHNAWPVAWRRGALPSAPVLRTTGLLDPDLADQVADWYTGTATAPRAAYRALERGTARLSHVIRRARRSGGLGVCVHDVRTEHEPNQNAAELCAELRRHGPLRLRSITCDAPPPLLGNQEVGVVDELRGGP